MFHSSTRGLVLACSSGLRGQSNGPTWRYALALLLALATWVAIGSLSRAGPFEVPEDVKGGYLAIRSGPGLGHDIAGIYVAGTVGIEIDGCRRGDDGGKSKKDWCSLAGTDGELWVSSCCIVDSASPSARLGNPRGYLTAVLPETLYKYRCTDDYSRCSEPQVIESGDPRDYAFALFSDGVRYTRNGIAHYCLSEWREYSFDELPYQYPTNYFGCRFELAGDKYRVWVEERAYEGEVDFLAKSYFEIDAAAQTCSGQERGREIDLPMPEDPFGPLYEMRWSNECPLRKAK